MENKHTNNTFKIGLIILSFGLLTSILGEYIISREVNGYIQLAATGVWFYVGMRLSKKIYKLILNK
jgi:hypothetical protein